jgi:hypothetical protein
MSTTPPSSPAAWYPDPTGRHQLRFWNGTIWTEHVHDDGRNGIDHLDGRQAVDLNTTPTKIQEQVTRTDSRRGAGITPTGTGGGSLFTEPILVVNQKMKVVELTNQYAVFNAQGEQIGSVNEVGQTTLKKLMRATTKMDQYFTHRLEIRDAQGATQLILTRPRKVFKSAIVVEDAEGQPIGRIAQENVIGKINFALEGLNGEKLGSIKAENWRAWNFRIDDLTGNEIGRLTKTFEGVAKTLFTTADNYVCQIHQDLPQPLHSLVVASALSIDTALKQDARGLS